MSKIDIPKSQEMYKRGCDILATNVEVREAKILQRSEIIMMDIVQEIRKYPQKFKIETLITEGEDSLEIARNISEVFRSQSYAVDICSLEGVQLIIKWNNEPPF